MIHAVSATIDKKGRGEGSEMAVIGMFLFFHNYIGAPLLNLLCKIVAWLKFLDIPTWFRNATAWSRTPKMILIKHAYHMPPYRAKNKL